MTPPKPDIGHNNRAILLTSTIEQRKEELMKTMTKPDNEWSELDELLEELVMQGATYADGYLKDPNYVKAYKQAKAATQALLTKKIVEARLNEWAYIEPTIQKNDQALSVMRQRLKELKGSHE